jgi:ASCH domain
MPNVAARPNPAMLALSVRQPAAEGIIRGTKMVEIRSRLTRVRGRILIYASLGRYDAEDEADLMREFGICDVTCDELPRFAVIGSVELFDCRRGDAGDGFEWWLRRPERAAEFRRPTEHPQPVWFYPWKT